MTKTYDLIILGGGAAAFAAATKVSDLGKSAVMINAGLPIGGTCVNVGCVPSKHLLAVGAEHRGHAHSAFEALTPGDEASIDFRKAIAGKNHVVSSLRAKNYADVLTSLTDVDLIESRGRFVSADTIEADGKLIAGSSVLIATGSSTRRLDVPGLEDAGYHTNRNDHGPGDPAGVLAGRRRRAAGP